MALAAILVVESQAQVKTYDLKKGEAFDLLLLDQIPETGELFQDYFKTAGAVAKEYGYLPQRGYRVKQEPLQGNYWPSLVIIAKWKDYDKRTQFLTDVVKKVPDFHARRRQLWSTFFLTYWEVEKDQKVEVRADKYNVMTAYWSEDEASFNSFTDNWKNTANEHGGKVLLELNDGKSPFGYAYAPEFLTITQWESKEAFDKFYQKNLSMPHQGVKHVNQFIIE